MTIEFLFYNYKNLISKIEELAEKTKTKVNTQLDRREKNSQRILTRRNITRSKSIYNTEKTNRDNSRFEIRCTINCKRSSEYTRRMDQFY